MDATETRQRRGPRTLSAAAGGLLVAAGVLLLVGQLTGWTPWPGGGWLTWSDAWPLVPIGAGLGLLLLALAGVPEAAWLAIPGAVLTAVGLLLLVDHLTGQWQTWAYAWTLAFPTAIGIGLWLQGWRSGRPELVGRGRRLAGLGVALFFAFAVFFELGLNLSGVFAPGLAGVLVPALLIAAGAYLLLRSARRPSESADPGP